MPFITREDGEHFVIPSYRDVLDATRKSALKKEILTLSQSYGDFITLQRKNPTQYEVAFSPDTGYLLGESIWHYFKKPVDLIYCEAIPNTTEAILVIVKDSGVYLDGSFPIDSIPEELIIFLTQENNFEIYTYGDVPISQQPEDGKFSFEAASVKNFTVLDKPVFPTLPLLKMYQLQLVDPVLKANAIGVFPTKQLVTVGLIIGAVWFMWSYLSSRETEIPVVKPQPTNPYLGYNAVLSSPAPNEEIKAFLATLRLLFTMPGWTVKKIEYSQGTWYASVISNGSKIENILEWTKENDINTEIKQDGIYLSKSVSLDNRPTPDKIYPMKDVIATFVDRLSDIYPGNHVTLGEFVHKDVYTDVVFTIDLAGITPTVLSLIGSLFKDMPFVLQNISIEVKNGVINGSINIEAVGS